MSRSPLLRSSLADDVATYVAFGEHRAGTETETRTAAWLSDRLGALGFTVEQQSVPICTILSPGGTLTAGDTTAPVFPQWLPPAEALAAPIVAPIVALAAPAGTPSIRVMTQPATARGNWGKTQDAWVAEAVAKNAAALVIAPDGGSGELYVSNQHDLRPLAIPVAIVAPCALPTLFPHVERGAVARLALAGHLTDASAHTVIGRKSGRGQALVISTPLTGWFTCGAERGPGVALLLRMAETLAKSTRPVVVVGTGSHEIAHRGMAHFLQNGAPPPNDVRFWMHFGASIGARKLDATSRVKSWHRLVGTMWSEPAVREALGKLVPDYLDGSGTAPGEAGQIIGAGYDWFAGMVGTFPGFHTPADRGEAIDYELLEQITEASERLLRQADQDELP